MPCPEASGVASMTIKATLQARHRSTSWSLSGQRARHAGRPLSASARRPAGLYRTASDSDDQVERHTPGAPAGSSDWESSAGASIG